MLVQLETQTLLDLTTHSFSLYATQLLASNIKDNNITYQNASLKIDALHSKFKSLGIKQGDKVAICSENTPNWGVVYLAITTMGAIVVPILPDFHSNEVHHIIKHSEAKAIFLSKKQRTRLSANDFSSALEYSFFIETLMFFDDDDLCLAKSPEKTSLMETMRKGLIKSKDRALKTLNIQPDDVAAIIYTSGTTGQSKGVMLSHKNLISQIQQAAILVDIHPKDKFLSILPLAHTFECSVGFLVPFANGASIYYLNKIPSPKIILAAMAKVQPTCMLSVPLVIEKIYKSKVQANFNKNKVVKFLYENVPFIRKKLHKLAGKKLLQSFGGQMRFFGIGGAKLSPFVEQFLIEANFPYAIGYGLTETSPIIAGAIPYKTKLGSTGLMAAGIEYRFCKQDKSQRDGELHVRGPNIMIGYYKDTERTAEVLDADGWFNTGDLGYMDDEGILYINGRSKNVIIGSSGENIYPETVEAVLNQNPMVCDSLVYADNEKIVAKLFIDYDKFDEIHNIKTTSDSALHKTIITLLEEIKMTANSQLAHYAKVSRVIEQTVPFIKTPTEKIKRYLHMPE